MRVSILAPLAILPLLLSGNSCIRAQHHDQNVVIAKDRTTRSGWLGVSTQDMTPKIARTMDIKTTEGALVKEVVEDSPAEKAGLKEDDVIVEFEGKRITDADDLQRAVRKTSPGTTAKVTVMRKEEKKTITVEIARLPRRYDSDAFRISPDIEPPIPPIPPVPRMHFSRSSMIYGLTLMDIGEQLGNYFEIPGGRGILVEEVEKGSAADVAGFKAGDVITKVGKESVENTRDVISELRDIRDTANVDFAILRKGTQKTITMKIEDGQRSGSHHRFRPGIMPYHFEFEFFDTHDRDVLKETMQRLRGELRSIGTSIQEQMRELREKLRTELRSVSS
jgi:membrane-associated protease RseP (regulator of RpoE activity)